MQLNTNAYSNVFTNSAEYLFKENYTHLCTKTGDNLLIMQEIIYAQINLWYKDHANSTV